MGIWPAHSPPTPTPTPAYCACYIVEVEICSALATQLGKAG